MVLEVRDWLHVMEQTAARVLSQLGNKDQPSKEFQTLIRHIGEAKTKHVSLVHISRDFVYGLLLERSYRRCCSDTIELVKCPDSGHEAVLDGQGRIYFRGQGVFT